MVASVQCLTVRFRSTQTKQSTQRFRHNIGSAFAFTKNYLFTTHNLLQELDPDFDIDSVWISHPADPLTKLVCKVRIVGSVQELDVAVLECDEFDFPDYDLRPMPPQNPLVIYIAQRSQSLKSELCRGTASPLRGPYEGLCCIRPMERCNGAPVLDSHGKVIGMLKSRVSFATSDGLMHALKQIGMSLDDDEYPEVESLCSLWELNKAIAEHAVATLIRKRHAEEQGGRATKVAKNSTLSGEEHQMSRAHEQGTNDDTNHVNDSSMLNPCAQTVLEFAEAAHAKTTERPHFPQPEPTALQEKHRLDENESVYHSQSAQTPSAYRAPVVIRSEQSLEKTVGYTHYSRNQPLPNLPFYQPLSLHKCRDSPVCENNMQFLNREAHVNSRLGDIYSSSCYNRGERSLDGENWASSRSFDSPPALMIPPGLPPSDAVRVQRQPSASENTSVYCNYYPNVMQTPSGWNPSSVYQQQQQMPLTFTQPMYPNIPATAPPLTPITFNGARLPYIYPQARKPFVPTQAVYYTTRATDSNAPLPPPNRSVTRNFRTIDETQLHHGRRQDADETGNRRWQSINWDQVPPAPPNSDQDALSSSRGYVPPPTSMEDFSISPFNMKSIRKSPTPR